MVPALENVGSLVPEVLATNSIMLKEAIIGVARARGACGRRNEKKIDIVVEDSGKLIL